MILLSRLIKAHFSNPYKQSNKVILIKPFQQNDGQDEDHLPQHDEINHSLYIEQAKEEAERIIAEANHYSAAVKQGIEEEKQRWEEEKERLMMEAQQEGFAAGFEAGKKQGYEEMSGLIEHAKGIVALSKEDYQHKIESSEQMILHIGLKVAEKILGTQLKENPEYFLDLVKRTIKEARNYREVQLHVNPVHYELLLSHKDELDAIFPRETQLYIFPDEELAEESCVIESENGRIDASIDEQLEVIRGKLYELLESEQGEIS